MKNVFIVQGNVNSDNRKEFIGVAKSYEECFKITLKNSNFIYAYFTINEYDVKNQKYIGTDKLIALNQEYSEDGHLEPINKRNKDGFCHVGLWGPYCNKCRDKKFLQSSLNKLKNNT